MSRAVRSVVVVVLMALASIAPSGGPATASPQVPRYSEATAGSGIDVTGLGNASAWADLTGDGRLDLLASNSSIPSQRTWLYRNNGDGTFTDISQASGLANASIRSVAIGDYDNDGWADIAATGYGFNERTQLWHNNGDRTFTEV